MVSLYGLQPLRHCKYSVGNHSSNVTTTVIPPSQGGSKIIRQNPGGISNVFAFFLENIIYLLDSPGEHKCRKSVRNNWDGLVFSHIDDFDCGKVIG
jgi:hypothetical protein